MNYKKYIVTTLLITLFANAEQSVYSDSDFVDAEKVAKKNSTEIFLLKQKISQLQEKIDGFKSVINAQQNEIMRLKEKNSNNYSKILNELSQRVAKLEATKSAVVVNNVADKTDVVNKDINKEKKELAKESLTTTETKLSNKELFKQSVLNFTKNRLTKAKKGFLILAAKDYKKASSSFYLGEISYKKKRYKDAIKYYQTSATLNENASYMDKLLLHTAISLKKIGKKNQAKEFFMAVIDSYPQSSSAKEAQKYLK